MSYKDRTRKTITLPSGATAVIRKFTTFDAMRSGDPPERARLRANGKLGKDEPHTKEETDYIIRANTYMAVECCLSYTLEGEKLVIVDRNPRDLTDSAGEISICEAPPEDVRALVSAILEFSGTKPKEVGEDARTFPAEQTNGRPVASAG